MANIFVISDTHFSHENILNFTLDNGEKMRHFANVEEMDQYMVDQWNSVIKPGDHVYHLGDVALKRPALQLVKKLKGKKRLVRGNHDIFKLSSYVEVGFEEVYGVRVLDNVVMSHMPIHPHSVKECWVGNIHGHLHNNEPQWSLGPRYFNVSVEQIGYTPIPLETVKQRMLVAQQTPAIFNTMEGI